MRGDRKICLGLAGDGMLCQRWKLRSTEDKKTQLSGDVEKWKIAGSFDFSKGNPPVGRFLAGEGFNRTCYKWVW